MKGALLFALVSFFTLTVVIDAANRKANVRYVNSMPQFGRANFSASSPQTLVFDQVPGGAVTDYTSIDAKPWSFTSSYFANVKATSDQIDVDSDSYATVYTCQQGKRRLKNQMVYDTGRSVNANKALVRTLNLAQYNYDIDVYNGNNSLFNNLPYCSPSAYIQVPPGLYDFDWTISGDKKRQACSDASCGLPNVTKSQIKPGFSYTYFVTPTGSYVTQDATRRTTRSVSESVARRFDPAAASTVNEEKVDVTRAKEEKPQAQARRKRVGRTADA